MQITLQIHKKAGWKQLKPNSAIRYVQHSRQEMEVYLPGRSLRTWQPEDYQQFAVFQMRADF